MHTPLMALSQRICALLMLVLLSCLPTAGMAATKVVRVDPDALQDFINKHRHVVVLFTSPSEDCSACLSADTTFEQAAQAAEKAPWHYVRVQSMYWDRVPEMGPEIKMRALPDHVVFVDGKETGRVTGRARDAHALAARIAAIQNGTRRDDAKPSALEISALRLNARSQLFNSLSALCGKLHPDSRDVYSAIFKDWETRNREALEHAARQFLRAVAGPRKSLASDILDQETAATKRWLQDDQKVAFGRDPTADECSQIITTLAVRELP